jgi:nuclear pore complex protein Nup155
LKENEKIIEIMIDNEREILYTIAENSTIQVFDIRNEKLQLITKYTTLNKDLNKFLNEEKYKKEIKLNSIYSISKIESNTIHMVCISTKGDRFYFTTNNFMDESNDRPKYLCLLDVKFINENDNNNNNMNIHESYYSNNIFFFSDGVSEGFY